MNSRRKHPSCCSCLRLRASNGSKRIDDLMRGCPFWDKELLDSPSLFLSLCLSQCSSSNGHRWLQRVIQPNLLHIFLLLTFNASTYQNDHNDSLTMKNKTGWGRADVWVLGKRMEFIIFAFTPQTKLMYLSVNKHKLSHIRVFACD